MQAFGVTRPNPRRRRVYDRASESIRFDELDDVETRDDLAVGGRLELEPEPDDDAIWSSRSGPIAVCVDVLGEAENAPLPSLIVSNQVTIAISVVNNVLIPSVCFLAKSYNSTKKNS